MDLAWTLAPVLAGAALGVGAARAAAVWPAEPGAASRARSLLIVTGVMALSAWAVVVTPGPAALLGAILAAALVLLAVLDVQYYWLPLKLTVPLTALGLVAAYAQGALIDGAIGAVAGWGAFTVLSWTFERLLKKRGLGGGDAWLAAAAGAWTGLQGLPFVVLIAALGAVVFTAVFAVVRRRAEARPIPFGAWLAGATWLVWLYGPAAMGAG